MMHFKDREVYTADPGAEACGVCPARTEVRVVDDLLYGVNNHGHVTLAVVLRSEAQRKALINCGWAEVQIDGLTCRARTVSIEYFEKYFNPKIGNTSSTRIISEDFVFKKTNLKGMEVRKTFSMGWGGLCLVELSKNVGGGGADGQGKAGHCVIVPTKAIKTVKKENSKEVKNG